MISILVVIVVWGAIYYLATNLVPLPPKALMVINVLFGLFLFLFILQVLGLWHGLPIDLR